ncbi:divalent metal cation transporter [Streptomyces globosus]|uniref:divalent metal cation transporter n=1 Tax=Streptomyces globosus TaxID=68209 RepID=UPI002F960296
MSGFLGRSLPLSVRRGITLLPSMAVLFAGVDPTSALVWSQVVPSFGIPFALVPLILRTRSRTAVGPLANRPLTTAAASVVAALVIGLNAYLIRQTLSGSRRAPPRPYCFPHHSRVCTSSCYCM